MGKNLGKLDKQGFWIISDKLEFAKRVLVSSLTNRNTYSTDEAGIVPGVAERLQELVSGLDGELAAMAPSPKQTVEVLFLKETKTHVGLQV